MTDKEKEILITILRDIETKLCNDFFTWDLGENIDKLLKEFDKE